MEPDLGVEYRCKACGEQYDERADAVSCFESHTRNLSEMVERVGVALVD